MEMLVGFIHQGAEDAGEKVCSIRAATPRLQPAIGSPSQKDDLPPDGKQASLFRSLTANQDAAGAAVGAAGSRTI